MQTPGMSDARIDGLQLLFRETGNPKEVLELGEFSPRTPGEGEVLVKLLAAPINPADLNTVEGTYGVKLELPGVPGIEGCGEVVESRAEGFAPGERVMFLKRASTWASHTVVAADVLFKLPPAIDPVQAAMLKVNPATAWQLLTGFETLKKGDWIVQNLGNSAVGRCVIQIAKDLGVRTISFVRREEQFAELKALGADEVLVDGQEGFDKAKEILGKTKARLAFNAVGGDSALRVMKLLGNAGTHVTYGAMGKQPVTVPNGMILFADVRVRGLWVTRWAENAPHDEVLATYQDLAERVAAGKIVQPVDRTYGLGEFAEALERLESPERKGKVLFRMS